ncbi:MAG: TetR/AcrR family transcriptional regulator [Ignavibacteriaceae bacterium]|nr:TetR/AcrR family transcriptional regulator [Ignavibacteriaceae bacterium]
MNESLSKEREEQIILAARKVFAHYGFSKTTMEDISTEVEMGKASLYYYFPTKENLFQTVILHEQNEFIKKAVSLLAKQDSAEKKLRMYVEERLKFIQDLVNLGTLAFNAVRDRHAIFLKMYESFNEKEIGIVNKIIEEGKRRGEFISSIPKGYANLLMHLLHGLRLRSIKSLTSGEVDTKIYRELRREMMMTIDVFIKIIQSK